MNKVASGSKSLRTTLLYYRLPYDTKINNLAGLKSTFRCIVPPCGTLRTLRYFAVFSTTVVKCGLNGTSSVQGLKIKDIVQPCELQKINAFKWSCAHKGISSLISVFKIASKL